MKAFQNITILPTPDIGHYFLWEKIFQHLHLALVELQSQEGKSSIGLAFPDYKASDYKLGNRLRLFGPDENELNKLAAKKWLHGLSDYVHITGIRSVPEQVTQYAIYKRQQPKSSLERLARRKAKREGITLEASLNALKGFEEQHVKTPFIQMNSQSSQKRFRLFIDKEIVDEPNVGLFSTYGLSLNQSTVPDFNH